MTFPHFDYINPYLFPETFKIVIVFFARNGALLILAGVLLYFLIVEPYLTYKRNGTFSYRRTLYRVLFLVVSVTSAYICVHILKTIFNEMRPFLADPNIIPLFVHGANDSFPSGHASMFSALAMATYYLKYKSLTIVALLALLVSLARVFAGVHYFHDILAGWVLGIGVTALIYFLYSRMRETKATFV